MIIGSLAVFLAVFMYIQNSIKGDLTRIHAARTVIKTSHESVKYLTELKNQAPLAEQYGAQLSLLLPKKEELLAFPKWLDGIARANNVSFKFGFQGENNPSSSGAPGNVDFSLAAEGTMENLRNFINAVESRSNRYIVDLESMNFEGNSQKYNLTSGGKLFFK